MSTVMRFEGLELDLGSGAVNVDGAKASLTRTEILIHAMLLRHKGQFIDRAEILHEAWEDESTASERTVDTTISRMRKKIGPYARHIINRQGYGYGFSE